MVCTRSIIGIVLLCPKNVRPVLQEACKRLARGLQERPYFRITSHRFLVFPERTDGVLPSLAWWRGSDQRPARAKNVWSFTPTCNIITLFLPLRQLSHYNTIIPPVVEYVVSVENAVSVPQGMHIQWRLRFKRGRFQPGIFLSNPAFCYTVLATL